MLSQQDITIIKGLFDEQNRILDKRFEAIDQRFEAIDQRFDAIDQKLADHDRHFEAIDQKLADHDKQFEKIDKRFNETEDRLLRNMLEIEAHLDQKIDHVRDSLSTRIDNLENYYRIRHLEESNQSTMLNMILDHDKRIEALEREIQY